jgi:hypothetical protein
LSSNTTCYFGGTVTPTQCPDGYICGIPYQPPWPAPPGYSEQTLSTLEPPIQGGSRKLHGCSEGSYCGWGAVWSANSTELACPEGYYCPYPSVVEPIPCSANKTCLPGNCSRIPYCPAGSFVDNFCPAGFWCSSTKHAEKCSLGTYCPEGSMLWQVCPARKYCPSPMVALECPKGFYCPQGSYAVPASILCAATACHVVACRCDEARQM